MFRVFLVLTFPHFDWILGDKEYLSVVSSNTRKYWPERLQISILFTQCCSYKETCQFWKKNFFIKQLLPYFSLIFSLLWVCDFNEWINEWIKSVQSGQGIVEKFTKFWKFNKRGFLMDSFTADISWFSSTVFKICFCSGRLDGPNQIPAF